MRRVDVVKSIMHQTGIETTDIEIVVEALFQTIKKQVAKGERVDFRGFGAFVPKKLGAKRGRNFWTKGIVEVPERTVPAFKHSKKYFKISNV